MNDATQTMTLTEFLLARFAEDEAVARKATHQKVAGPSHGHWHADSWHLTNGQLEAADRAHIARFDPERVLAECEAKRNLITLVESDGTYSGDWMEGRALAHLAAPYADHPDYRPEWRP